MGLCIGFVALWVMIPLNVQSYRIGVGIADMTGPVAEVAFMGYAHPDQRGEGLHLRQFARSFIVGDEKGRIVFVSADCGMMGTAVRQQVLRNLSYSFQNMYTDQNVMISGTHTHSTPGGFLLDIIFDLNSFGFVEDTFNAYVNGIVKSITMAHENMVDGKLFLSRGEIMDVSINRSPTAYLNNPIEERQKYEFDVDKSFVQLKFRTDSDEPLGVLTWFAVHATSMNNTNKLVSSDNVGFASLMFEKKMKEYGKEQFVAAFASSNLGDVSPNIMGPKCVPSGKECDRETSTCADPQDKCIASGPGKNMFDSTYIIANRILDSAWDAWNTHNEEEITGPVRFVHQYVHMPSQVVNYKDPLTGNVTVGEGCLPAMGYSFAAGTTDGPGAFSFKQGTKTTNPLWNALTSIIAGPSQEQIDCHAPKPILLSTGEMNFPLEWQPHIVSTQLAVLGRVAIACVPGEFTTMSGRRMRNALHRTLNLKGPEYVVIAGLCNTYSDYITTPEEYQVQRYEGASTIFGPHTLPIYLEQYKKLAKHIIDGTLPDPGPYPYMNMSNRISLLPGVIFDFPGFGKNFGYVERNPKDYVRPGETVSVTFVAGHPRNGLINESTFLKVEKKISTDKWIVVATDADWETKFIWRRKLTIAGTSEAEIRWEVPKEAAEGVYRISHYGSYKDIWGGIESYSGTSRTFKVVPAKK